MEIQNHEINYSKNGAGVIGKPVEDSIAPETSLNQSETIQADSSQQKRQPGLLLKFWHWLGVKDKTLWDYLQLLIVPLLLIVVTDGINQSQKRVEELRVEQEKQATIQRAEQERAAAADRVKQDTLNAYISSMTELIKAGLGEGEDVKAPLKPIALSRTILTLRELDANRNSIVLGFLKDLNLIVRDSDTQEGLQTEYEQKKADYEACLSRNAKARAKAEPTEDCLDRPTPPPSLYLGGTDLSKADFRNVDLNTVNLAETNLRGADLSNAVLIDTNLEKADLTDANLTGANLTGAILTDARLPAEHFLKNVRYCGTTMPDGTTKSDGCSFTPQAGSQYRVVSGNDSAISNRGWTISAYRDPAEQNGETDILIPHGTIVTLTGDYSSQGGTMWVKIKDEGNIGGWVDRTYLVPVQPNHTGR